MDSSIVDFSQARIAAAILLVIYAAAVLILWPRELGFLKSVKPAYRTRFIILDIVFQITILLVLIPPIVTKMDTLNSWIVFGVGFFGLWIAVVWLAFSRYIYTYRYLIKHHDHVKNEITRLQHQASMESEKIE